jgi:hypothetical protein
MLSFAQGQQAKIGRATDFAAGSSWKYWKTEQFRVL